MTYDTRIITLLRELGITPNYKGFHQLAMALQLCMEKPERLTLVTKLLYPDVAEKCHTKWTSVERNMRTMIDMIWAENRPWLDTISHRKLQKKPCIGQMLSILMFYIDTNPPYSISA